MDIVNTKGITLKQVCNIFPARILPCYLWRQFVLFVGILAPVDLSRSHRSRRFLFYSFTIYIRSTTPKYPLSYFVDNESLAMVREIVMGCGCARSENARNDGPIRFESRHLAVKMRSSSCGAVNAEKQIPLNHTSPFSLESSNIGIFGWIPLFIPHSLPSHPIIDIPPDTIVSRPS